MADTYISSRAFPSTLLSREPSLVVSPESYPVLLPGLDFFNHKRGQPVSWGISLIERPTSPILSGFSASNPTDTELCVSLTINTPILEGAEVFNNYGPKPNSSPRYKRLLRAITGEAKPWELTMQHCCGVARR